MTLRARITGTGMYVPERVVTNKDLEELMDTSDEWIRQRCGIEERHWINEGQGPVDLPGQLCWQENCEGQARGQQLSAKHVEPQHSDLPFRHSLSRFRSYGLSMLCEGADPATLATCIVL